MVPREGHRGHLVGHDGRATHELSGLRDGHPPGHPVPRSGAHRQLESRAAGEGVRRGRSLRVPLHGDADPAGGLDGGPGPPDRDLLSAARATLAGLAATLVGVGLARFAYTPLLPALIAAGWFPPASAAYLGAANLAGYLAGALVARTLAARIGAV